MAYENQKEPGLPITNTEQRETVNLLPRIYRSDSNRKFLQATMDQLVQPGTVKKINGYIGRQNSKSTTSSDIFLHAPDKDRQDYQLEPAAVIKDYNGNLTFFKDYNDHINHVDVLGGITNNHERINKQEMYSWNPNICFDKFVNYQNYYWLPYGPMTIEIYGDQKEIKNTYTVTTVDDGDNYAYVFDTESNTRNPVLKLYRGQTYTFEINSKNNPFSIKTKRETGDTYLYDGVLSANRIEQGTIEFTVDNNCPDILYYVSENDINTGGEFHVYDIKDNTELDINSIIIGKKYCTLPNNVELSNGMKIAFTGEVYPSTYSTGAWYVEGVGEYIKLISERSLDIITPYSVETALLFDDEPFDMSFFGSETTSPKEKDYIVINRASPDSNPWSRQNRWFHSEVITKSFEYNNVIPEFDQSSRATRPIIEFNPGIKLYNYGHFAKEDVDLLDTSTTDVFSTVEGCVGYNIDGVDLIHGMRVLFTADTDPMVSGKIYKVNFENVNLPGRRIDFTASSYYIDITKNTIKFQSDHGLLTGYQVSYLNSGYPSIDGLEHRKRYYVKAIDDFTIALYNDKDFKIQVDIKSTGTGDHVFELYTGARRQIRLVEEHDSVPLSMETILVKSGKTHQGTIYWYDGTTWKLGQYKKTISQFPLFDVFDEYGNSYGDPEVYEGNNFIGTEIFSYKIGTGSIDKELLFPVSYKNINNIGDISFEFDLATDVMEYKNQYGTYAKNIKVGYLRKIYSLNDYKYINGWDICKVENTQPIVRIFKEKVQLNNFPIDMYDATNIPDLTVKVYINGKRLPSSSFSIEDGVVRKYVKLDKDVGENDVVTLKCTSSVPKNENGYYDIPLNLQNNPLNGDISEFTLGEVIDHVDSIIDNITAFKGSYPGLSNLRDLGNLVPYGVRFVQHSSPLNLSLYHLGNNSVNVVEAIDNAREDYGRFKRAFLLSAYNSGIDADPRTHVDYILKDITSNIPNTSSYYLSDMFGFSASNIITHNIFDSKTKFYAISSHFDLNTLSNKSVILYLNETQLVHGREYVFIDDNFVELLCDISYGDLLEIFEYVSTDGSFCPATPTKLGLYPAYEPRIYIDDTYVEPMKVIQGHDGSITIAFDDYRDELLLELEKRIFNNLKVKYNPRMFDIYDYIPGYSRKTQYNMDEFNDISSLSFYQWTRHVNQDFTKQTGFDRTNAFTFNYRGNQSPDGREVPAFWRGMCSWMLDTDRPHICPWEMLGFSIEPKWWRDIYGEAPYTSNNLLLWDDIKNGIIREPNKPLVVNEKFIRTILESGIPVDEYGKLLDPTACNMAYGFIKETGDGYYVFGDGAPVESAWKKSSHYPFSVIRTILLMNPSNTLGICLDRSRIIRNLCNQLIYKDTNLRLKLHDIVIPSNVKTKERIMTSGLVNYVVDYISSDVTYRNETYKQDLINITNNISSKLGGFTSPEKYRLVLDSKSPTSSGGVFVPPENYTIQLNTTSPIKKITYSGILISKVSEGFEIKGYVQDALHFKYYPVTRIDKVVRVGGISESYVNWESRQNYIAGKLLKENNVYYRVKVNHVSGDTFDPSLYSRLPELPIIGGVDAEIRTVTDFSTILTLRYGTILGSMQQVVDFIVGYSVYLAKQGFIFDEYNPTLKAVTNWELSIKEFLFWTTQNWKDGSVLSLSPAANKLILNTENAVVHDLTDKFYKYQIFRVDGQKLNLHNIDVYRGRSRFEMSSIDTNHGIYGAVLFLEQKEHVLILDNKTMFNDTIYDLEPGYRQERIKVYGYISTNWDGGFNVPGFIYDDVKINDWNPWVDYNLGDIVKYKEFYYTASKFLQGVEFFNENDWYILENKPKSKMLPNWDYRTTQFLDYYDLDTDNFDVDQQKMAQHLIGYQKRQYLENIIKDDVSQYKFYQGMISEKGTVNVLNKLFDVLSSDEMDSITFNEEWAIRVGNYGSINAFDEIEFTLSEDLFRTNPQPFKLVGAKNESETDLVYEQTYQDVYIKPVGYNHNPWPLKKSNSQYLRTPGYVKYDQVSKYVDTIDDLLFTSVDGIYDGDYIWTAFENRDWNVYRFQKLDRTIEYIEYKNNKVTFILDQLSDIEVGDVIAIKNDSNIQRFYKISEKVNRTFVSYIELDDWLDPDITQNLLLYILHKQRTDNIDNANDIIPLDINKNEKIWVDDSGDGLWAVYENSPVYEKYNVGDGKSSYGELFGKKISVSDNGLYCVISSDDGVNVFRKDNSSDKEWDFFQKIVVDGTISENNDDFGMETAISPDNLWIAISNPGASNIKYSLHNNLNVVNTQYQPSSFSNQGYVSLYKFTENDIYELQIIIVSESPTNDELFGSRLVFAKQSDQYILAISSLGYTERAESVTILKTFDDQWNYIWKQSLGQKGDQYGYNIDLSIDGAYLGISSPFSNNMSGIVYLYKYNESTYSLVKEFNKDVIGHEDGDELGNGLSISRNSTYISFSSGLVDGSTPNQGKVYIYTLDNEPELHQVISSRFTDTDEQFGTAVKFCNDDKTLLIFAKNGDDYINFEFDGGETTFDEGTLAFTYLSKDAGRIDVYDRYNTKFIYGESLIKDFQSVPEDFYGYSIAAGNNTILVGALYDEDIENLRGSVYSYNKNKNVFSWKIINKEYMIPDVKKIKKAFLYNTKTNKLLTYLDVIDPVNGKIPGPADQEIKYKTFYDPAIYSYGNELVAVDDGMNWEEEQIGQLWWDLSRAKFLVTNDDDVIYRNATWNKLYDSASIDIYEWVETRYLPSEWDELSGTADGNTLNISGFTKYGDLVYSVKKVYDTVSETFVNTYYYWVRNITTIPDIEGRKLTAMQISKLISDPTGQGYPHISLTGASTYSLSNVSQYLNDTNVNLNVEYWIIDNHEINTHSQWKIISEHPNTKIPTLLEEKWIDSLVGTDISDRVVPDFTFPVKRRYGIQNRPRQSMFVNRQEAVKQLIERVNKILANKMIIDDVDLSPLHQMDPFPSIVSGRWDQVIDTERELRFIGTSLLRQAKLSAVVDNGIIVKIEIIDAGYGYINPPRIKINGHGNGAKVESVLDDKGRIIRVNILEGGVDYDSDTLLTIRSYAVLVRNDSTIFGNWSIHAWDIKTKKWNRIKNQSYNVTSYWSYSDWYDYGYSQYTYIDHSVDNTNSLLVLDSEVGDIVKVNNIGSGGWALFEKITNIYTNGISNYKTIGRQNGTIQFSENLYLYRPNIGFGGPLFDLLQYDISATVELRIILETIKNNILVDNLYVEYLRLFFSSIRYVLHEQPFVDWIFKTSYVKATHHVGDLKQKVTYNNDNLESFEDYINEVKPYRTKIREYISNYTNTEITHSVSTDFDLPVLLSEAKTDVMRVVNEEGQIVANSYKIAEYPWRHWYDNVGFSVIDIQIVDGGSGYIRRPTIRINGGYGIGASAVAYIAAGKVNRIQIISNGSGYLSAPSITFEGGMTSDGVTARAIAIIENTVIRTNKIAMKFDRISKKYLISELLVTETFTGSGSRLQFPLIWSPNTVHDKSKVIVDGIEILQSSYTLSYKKNIDKGYTYYTGLLTFNQAPLSGSTIHITYEKNIRHLSATDRINYFYNPDTNQIGKDLSQLMTGVEYEGSKLDGMGFDVYGGWDSLPWFSDLWDGYDPEYTDYKVRVITGTNEIDLPYVPDIGEIITVYVNDIRVDDPNFGSDLQENETAVMKSIIGNGVDTKWYIPDIAYYYNNVAVDNVSKVMANKYILLTSERHFIVADSTIIIDSFSVNVYQYAKYQIQVSNPIGSYTNDLIIAYNGVNISVYETPIINSGYVVGTFEATLIDDNVEIKFLSGSDNVQVIFIKTLISINATSEDLQNVSEYVCDKHIMLSTFARQLTEKVAIDSFNVDNFAFGKYTINMKYNQEYYSCDVIILHDTQSSKFVYLNDYSTNNVLGELTTEVIDNHVVLNIRPLYGTTDVVVLRELLIKRELSNTFGISQMLMDNNYSYQGVYKNILTSGLFNIDTFDVNDITSARYEIYISNINGSQYNEVYIVNNSGNIEYEVSISSSYGNDLGQLSVYGASTECIIQFDSIYQDNTIICSKTLVKSNPELTYDYVTFRKISSDGSMMSRNDIDTQLDGGKFVGSSLINAIGFSPDDINVDCDGFGTPINSPAPEEVVPGHVLDAVSIKVFNRADSGKQNIIYKNYISDGFTNEYKIGQYFPSGRSVIVVKDNEIMDENLYTIEWNKSTISFKLVLPPNILFSVISFGYNSETLLDIGHVISDGTTTEYLTNAPWVSNLNSYILVDGNSVNYALFKTGEDYEHPYNVGIKFGAVINKGSLISYVIDTKSDTDPSYMTSSVAKNQIILSDGTSYTYGLINLPQSVLSDYRLNPFETSIIVKTEDGILNPPSNVYITMKDNLTTYNIPRYKFSPYSVDTSEIKVYLDKKELQNGKDYIIDFSKIDVIISNITYVDGGLLTVSINTDSDYVINTDGTITFSKLYPVNTSIEVITFYNNSTMEIERTVDVIESATLLQPGTSDYFQFSNIKVGHFILRRPAISHDYVWIIKNGKLLTHSVDYYLDEDYLKVILTDHLLETDIIQVIMFGGNIGTNSYGYMQFKDMLNRIHYKRISKNKCTRLTKELRQRDVEIFVEDGEVLDNPSPSQNIPGIIEINGERIEYFSKVGNKLGQLRRATLGTGAPEKHRVGTYVLNIGVSETLPYSDSYLIETVKKNSIVSEVQLPFSVEKSNVDFDYRLNISDNVKPCDEIDVFVGGIKLKKRPYSRYEYENGYPESTEGDTKFDADFGIDGNKVILNTPVLPDTSIIVAKKQGTIWTTDGNSLSNSNTAVATFVKNTETIWPQYLVDKYQYILSTDSNIDIETDDNMPLELD